MKHMPCCALLFLLIPVFLYGQEHKIKEELVPEAVIASYHARYKKRPIKTWYEDEHGYAAIFQKGDLKPKAYFKNDGTWIKTNLKIKESAVSGPVKKAIKSTQWGDWKMAEAYRVETPEYAKLFELHMKKGKEVKVFLFEPAGKALEIQ